MHFPTIMNIHMLTSVLLENMKVVSKSLGFCTTLPVLFTQMYIFLFFAYFFFEGWNAWWDCLMLEHGGKTFFEWLLCARSLMFSISHNPEEIVSEGSRQSRRTASFLKCLVTHSLCSLIIENELRFGGTWETLGEPWASDWGHRDHVVGFCSCNKGTWWKETDLYATDCRVLLYVMWQNEAFNTYIRSFCASADNSLPASHFTLSKRQWLMGSPVPSQLLQPLWPLQPPCCSFSVPGHLTREPHICCPPGSHTAASLFSFPFLSKVHPILYFASRLPSSAFISSSQRSSPSDKLCNLLIHCANFLSSHGCF